MTLRPKSPNERSEPRQALPFMRPRCCLRNFTFFGINIFNPLSFALQALVPRPWSLLLSRKRPGGRGSRRALVPALLLLVDIAAIDPGLHADDPVSRVRLGEAIVDVGAQRMQRQTTLQVPLRTSNFVAVQAARYADLDPLAAEAQRGVHTLTHSPAEAHTLLQLEGDILAHQLSVELRLVHFEDVDEDFPRGALLNVGLELVDLGALAADDDARTRGADDQTQLVTRTLDFHRA